MGKSESARRTERGGNLIVRSDRVEVSGMEVVELPNKEIDVVRGERVVFLQIIKGNERKSGREIPPKDMNGGAGVLRGANNVYHRGVKRKGWGNMNLNNDQGVCQDYGFHARFFTFILSNSLHFR